jgi:hypothetical protein
LCQVAHKEWKRAEADLSLALALDNENAAVLKLQRQLPKLKERQFRDNKKLSKEMSKWLVSARPLCTSLVLLGVSLQTKC